MKELLFAGITIFLSYSISHFHLLENFQIPEILLITLLVFGLYGATSEITHSEIKSLHLDVFFAITGGVFLKAFFVGTLLFLITNNILSFLIGVILAQIDPLSTAKLTNEKHISKKGKNFIHSWASFDDPMTVLLALYICFPLFVVENGIDIFEYGKNLFLNIGFATFVYGVQQISKEKVWKKYFEWGLLIFCFLFSLWHGLVLAIALIGLFLRPERVAEISPKTVNISYYFALFCMGYIMGGHTVHGNTVFIGALSGIFIFMAHYIVVFLMRIKGLSSLSLRDFKKLQYAQYNGITSTILVLYFAPYFPELVVIIFFAMITVALEYHFFNYFFGQEKDSSGEIA